jgi:hypothetical protein
MAPVKKCMKYKYPHVLLDGVPHEAYHVPEGVHGEGYLGLRTMDRVAVAPRHHSKLTLVTIPAKVGEVGIIIDTKSNYFGMVVVVLELLEGDRVMFRNQTQPGTGRKPLGPCDRYAIVHCTLDKVMKSAA